MRRNNTVKIGLLVSISILLVISLFVKYPNLFHILPPSQPDSTTPPVEQSTNPNSAPVYYSDKAAILMYHNFDDHETGATISAAHFREQITTLQDKGYNFISLHQLSDFLAGKQEIPPNAVVITIDDGYRSVYKYAYPILAEKNIPASAFIIVKNVGADTNQIPKLTWDQMKEMQAHGISFYSHSYDSHRLIRRQDGKEGSELNTPKYLPAKKRYEIANEYQTRVNNDLLLSKTTLEQELNTEVDFLALPYGYTNNTVRRLAQEAGYQYLLTVTPGLVDKNSDKMTLPRIAAGEIGITGEQLHNTIISFTK